MQELETDRLRLERWTTAEADVDFLLDLYSRWEVQRFIGAQPRVMTDRADAVARANRLAGFDHPVHGLWAITEREASPNERGRRCGVLLLKDLPASGTGSPPSPSGETEIGWHLHPDAWGRGYGTEAATRVLRHAFDHGLSRVVAVTHPDNLASQRLARRIGMRDAGITDRFYDTVCALFEIGSATSGGRDQDPAG